MSTSAYKVPYLPQGTVFGVEDLAAIERVLMGGGKLACGPERDAFEEDFAGYTGARHAVSLTNCTIALEFATYLIGLAEGDEVIAATQTYQANVTPLLGLPVKVRFCDINPDSLNISVAHFESLITDRTRALYLVHHGGNPADMGPIMEIARRHGIRVVEDCAHALGSLYHGAAPGTLGDFGCWSFQSYKNISTLGEGGMLTTANDGAAAVARRIRAIEPDADFRPRQAGTSGLQDPGDEIERHAKNAYSEDCIAVRHPGTNSTMSEVAAAVGRVQLQKLDRLVVRRREIANHMNAAFAVTPGLRTQSQPQGVQSSHHLYTVFVDPESGIDRDQLIQLLEARGVQIQLRYFPIHLLPEWRRLGHGLGECPTAERIWFKEQINLPIYPQLEDWQVEFMIDSVVQVVTELS